MPATTSLLQNSLAMPGWLGRKVLDSLSYVFELAVFTFSTLAIWRPHRRALNRATYSSFLAQVIFTGVDAIPAVLILALTIGMGITTQLVYLLHSLTEVREAADILSRAVAMELGPLLTGIIMIGRTGSAITVDIGNMKVNREIESIDLMGIRVDDFIVIPRIMGATFCHLGLSLLFTGTILTSGILMSDLLFGIPSTEYFSAFFVTNPPIHIIIFVTKNLVFGLLIGSVACFHGLRVGRSRTEVPQQTQRAIINGLLLLFLADALLVWTIL